MLPYVQTTNSITFMLDTPVTVNQYSFNYKKILDLLPDITLEQLTPLLVPPETPDGIFQLYNTHQRLYIANIKDGGTNYFILEDNTWQDSPVLVNGEFMGVFASLDDIADAFPEYYI